MTTESKTQAQSEQTKTDLIDLHQAFAALLLKKIKQDAEKARELELQS